MMAERPDAAPPKNIVEAADRVIDKLEQAAAIQDAAPSKDEFADGSVPFYDVHPPSDAAQRKQTLWETIGWYASSVGTEHEKRERAVLDQAIDAALCTLLIDAAQLAAVRLLALKENWDSYGAPIISKIALDAALQLRNVLAAVPSFVPMSNGGVQIEWHSLGFDVELEIQPNGRLAHPKDAPEGPWERFAQELYRGHFITYRACYFCGRSAGHTDDCQWRNAVNRLKGDEK